MSNKIKIVESISAFLMKNILANGSRRKMSVITQSLPYNDHL